MNAESRLYTAQSCEQDWRVHTGTIDKAHVVGGEQVVYAGVSDRSQSVTPRFGVDGPKIPWHTDSYLHPIPHGRRGRIKSVSTATI